LTCLPPNHINGGTPDWKAYSTYAEENINRIELIPKKYQRFVKLLKTAADKSMPRRHRSNYIPCFTKECEKLLNEYEQEAMK